MSDEKSGVFIPLPLPNNHIFRYKAADDILELLYNNPHRNFTITELRATTNHGGKSVDNAIQILDSLNLLEKSRDGRHSLIQINRENIQKPSDPILQIPQEEFRTPIHTLLTELKQEQEDNLAGVVLFGSVARGEADRASDIDILVIVKNELMASRRTIQDLRQKTSNTRFGESRYEFQVMVESLETAENHGEKLREIFSEGIQLHTTDELAEVQEMVFSGKQ